MSRKWCAGWARSDDRRATARNLCQAACTLIKTPHADPRVGVRQERRSCRTRWTPQATRRMLLLPSAGAGSSGCQWSRSCRASRRSPFRREQDQSCLRRGIRMSRREVQPSLRISREGGGSARAASVQPPRRSNSRRFARSGEPRPSACVRTRSLRGMPAQRASNLSQQQAPQGVRGACSLARRSKLDAQSSTLHAVPHECSKSRTARGVLPRACSRAHGVRLNSRLRGQDGLVLEAHLTVRTAKEELLKAVG
jgi:hypothetical protein